MSNPFDNVPSTADIPESVDKRAMATLTALTERFEAAVSREEAIAKNLEELAGVMFETFLDDDGSIKDIAHSVEIISALLRPKRLWIDIANASRQLNAKCPQALRRTFAKTTVTFLTVIS